MWQQQQEHNKDMEKKVIKIIKKKIILWETVQRKFCVVVFGVKEKNLSRIAREKELERAKEIIAEKAEEGEGIIKQTEEVYRMKSIRKMEQDQWK